VNVILQIHICYIRFEFNGVRELVHLPPVLPVVDTYVDFLLHSIEIEMDNFLSDLSDLDLERLLLYSSYELQMSAS
jgi:hypothetical protein